MVCTYNETLFGRRKEGGMDTCCRNADEPKKYYAEWEKPGTGDQWLCDRSDVDGRIHRQKAGVWLPGAGEGRD